jgi:hypothetical protein
MKGHKQSKEHVEKVRKALTGIRRSEETKEKIKKARAKQIMPKGVKAYNWKGGKPACIDCKKTKSYAKRCWDCYIKYNIGSNNPAWREGASKKGYPPEFNAKLKLKIRTRDKFSCCLCGRTEKEERAELKQSLSVNHIDFNKKNCHESNLNTLCLRCNVRINFAREYWTKFFSK